MTATVPLTFTDVAEGNRGNNLHRIGKIKQHRKLLFVEQAAMEEGSQVECRDLVPPWLQIICRIQFLDMTMISNLRPLSSNGEAFKMITDPPPKLAITALGYDVVLLC